MSIPPTKEILMAFGSNEQPILLDGGQGETYRSGNIVLKPTTNVIETEWVGNVLNSIKSDKFRIAKPVKAQNGQWVFNNWIAFEFIAGKHIPNRFEDIYKVSVYFHNALKNIPRPDCFDTKNDPWALADKMAWGELELPLDFKQTKVALTKLSEARKNINLPNQIIHGDIGGNILFEDGLPPAVIDFSLYYRPAGFASAITIIDSLIWQGMSFDKISIFKDIEELNQLLIRALIRRICELVNISKMQKVDRSSDIATHLEIVNKIIHDVVKVIN